MSTDFLGEQSNTSISNEKSSSSFSLLPKTRNLSQSLRYVNESLASHKHRLEICNKLFTLRVFEWHGNEL